MATVTYDTENIRAMNLFESITGVEARDVILENENAYFIVPEGKAGMAIGKGGKVVNKVQDNLGKNVKVYEYSDNLGKFLNNIVPVDLRGVDIDDKEEDKEVEINVARDKKGRVVGKNGNKIDAIRDVLQRTHGVDNVSVE